MLLAVWLRSCSRTVKNVRTSEVHHFGIENNNRIEAVLLLSLYHIREHSSCRGMALCMKACCVIKVAMLRIMIKERLCIFVRAEKCQWCNCVRRKVFKFYGYWDGQNLK
jgi:hypothetical protein